MAMTLGRKIRKNFGSIITAIALMGTLATLAQPVDNYFALDPLPDEAPLLSYGSCSAEKVPSSCHYEQECDTTCNGIEALGVCLGTTEKTNCRQVEVCESQTEVTCSDPEPYDPDEAKDRETVTDCPAGTTYMNGQCEDVNAESYTVEEQCAWYEFGCHASNVADEVFTPETSTTTKWRQTCTGDVIQNKHIRGFRYKAEQKVVETCTTQKDGGEECEQEVKNEFRNKVDCTEDLNVCKEDSTGKPRCVFYPMELKIKSVIGELGTVWDTSIDARPVDE